MRHPSTRAVFSHWERLGGTERMPARTAVDPVGMREALADVFLVERPLSGPATFVLAGNRVCAILGNELGGTRFVDAWGNPALVGASLAHVAAGGVESGEATAMGRNAFRFEVLLMPLTHKGEPGGAMLGVLAPLGPGAWSGERLDGVALAWRRPLRPHVRPLARPELRLVAGGAA